MNELYKYPRTFHLPFSPGRSSDDKVMGEKELDNLLENEIVITVKMDGENTTCYHDGTIHARSLDSKNHPSRDWVKKYLSTKRYNLPTDWRICGENLFAKHSIKYTNLESYFYLFSIWDARNVCLSWRDTEIYAREWNLYLVPTIYQGKISRQELEKIIKEELNKDDEIEGFVIRLANPFSYRDFSKYIVKYVRENHVATDIHWMNGPLIRNELINQ